MYGLVNLGYANLVTTCVGCAMAGLAIGLRYYCKTITRAGLHQDDVWIFFATLLYWVAMVINIWGTFTGGKGKETLEIIIPGPFPVIEPKNFPIAERYLITRFAAFNLTIAAGYAVKMSILFFYRRIFDAKRYHQLNYILMGLSSVWFVGTIGAGFAVCRPLSFFWSPWTGSGDCYDYGKYFLGTGISDTIIDALILALPLHTVWGLKLPQKQKVIISGMFLLGSFAIITNAIRVAVIYQPGIIFVEFGEAEIWTNVHTTSAILCACLPLYKPLFGTLFNRIGGTTRGATGNGPFSEKMQGFKDNGALESSAGLMQNAGRPGTAASGMLEIARPATALSGTTFAPSRPMTARTLSPEDAKAAKDRDLPALPQGPKETVTSRSGKSFEIEHPHMPKSARAANFNQFPRTSVHNKEFGVAYSDRGETPDLPPLPTHPNQLIQPASFDKEIGAPLPPSPRRLESKSLPLKFARKPVYNQDLDGEISPRTVTPDSMYNKEMEVELSPRSLSPEPAFVKESEAEISPGSFSPRSLTPEPQWMVPPQTGHSQHSYNREMEPGTPFEEPDSPLTPGHPLKTKFSQQALGSRFEVPRRSITPQPERVTKPLELPVRARTPQPVSPLLLQPATYQPPRKPVPRIPQQVQPSPQQYAASPLPPSAAQFRPTPQQYAVPPRPLPPQQTMYRPTPQQYATPPARPVSNFRPGPRQFHEPPPVAPRKFREPPPVAPAQFHRPSPQLQPQPQLVARQPAPYPVEDDEDFVYEQRVPVQLHPSMQNEDHSAPYPRHSLTPLPLLVSKAKIESNLLQLSAQVYQPPARQQQQQQAALKSITLSTTSHNNSSMI